MILLLLNWICLNIKIIGKDKKKSEHSFVTDLISFDNVIKVEQNQMNI